MGRRNRRAAVPLYIRLLRLRHVHPSAWQRALFVEGSIALAAVLVLADTAPVVTLAVVPLVVAALVKGTDVLAGWLRHLDAAVPELPREAPRRAARRRPGAPSHR